MAPRFDACTRGIPAAMPLALILAAAGCSRPGPPTPPDVHWGQDVCSVCTMIVSEERYAAAAAVDTAQGRLESRVYDDIGCLLSDTGVETFPARWVRDLDGARWVDTDSAFFVPSGRLRTPMGSGVAAFGSREKAEAFAESEGAAVLDWNGLVQRDKSAHVVAPPPPAQAQ